MRSAESVLFSPKIDSIHLSRPRTRSNNFSDDSVDSSPGSSRSRTSSSSSSSSSSRSSSLASYSPKSSLLYGGEKGADLDTENIGHKIQLISLGKKADKNCGEAATHTKISAIKKSKSRDSCAVKHMSLSKQISVGSVAPFCEMSAQNALHSPFSPFGTVPDLSSNVSSPSSASIYPQKPFEAANEFDEVYLNKKQSGVDLLSELDFDQMDKMLDTITLYNLSSDEMKKVCRLEGSLYSSARVYSEYARDGYSIFHRLAETIQIDVEFSENTRLILKIDKDTVDSVLFAECIIAKIKREMATSNNPTQLSHIFNLRNQDNKTAFQWAAYCNQNKMLELLFTYEKENNDQNYIYSTLIIACQRGSYQSFKFLYDMHFSKPENVVWLNWKDPYGNNLLSYAIKYHSDESSNLIDNRKIISEILQNSLIDKKSRNNEGDSAVHLVCKNCYFTIEEKLEFLAQLETSFNELFTETNTYGQNAFNLWISLRPSYQDVVKHLGLTTEDYQYEAYPSYTIIQL